MSLRSICVTQLWLITHLRSQSRPHMFKLTTVWLILNNWLSEFDGKQLLADFVLPNDLCSNAVARGFQPSQVDRHFTDASSTVSYTVTAMMYVLIQRLVILLILIFSFLAEIQRLYGAKVWLCTVEQTCKQSNNWYRQGFYFSST